MVQVANNYMFRP